MFTTVQGLLLDKNIFVKTHSGAKSKFQELFIKTKILPLELGKILEDASALRQEADYEFDLGVSKDDARQTVDDAIKFLKVIKKLF